MNYSRKKAFTYLIYAIIFMNLAIGFWTLYTSGLTASLFSFACAIWLFMVHHLLNHISRLMKLVEEQNEEIERLKGEIVKRDVDVADFKRAMRI